MAKRMLGLLFIFTAFVGVSFAVQAGSGPIDFAVIVTPVVGKADGADGKSVSFFPSEVVTVLSKRGGDALVRGDDAQRVGWLPRSALLATSAFHPVRAWQGERRFEVASGSFDSGQIYFFKPDGTFRATFDDNHQPRKWSGRLYRKGRIIWAKPAKIGTGFATWSVFRETDGGRLCMLNFDNPDGCECAGSYDSGFAASCK